MNSAEQLVRKIGRINKTATKYKFCFIPKQLIIETDEKWCPEQIVLTCEHNGRRIMSKPRRLESSCNIACRRLVVWPDAIKDTIEFETTLYGTKANETLDDKKWTLVLEGTITKTKNGKIKMQHKSLAAYDFNIKNLISPIGEKAEVRLRLLPLIEAVRTCSLEIDVLTIREQIAAGFTDTPKIHAIQTQSYAASETVDVPPVPQLGRSAATNLTGENTPSINGTPFAMELFSTDSNWGNTPRLVIKPTEPPQQAEVQTFIAGSATTTNPTEHTPSNNGTTFPRELFRTGNDTPRLITKPTEPPFQAEVKAFIAKSAPLPQAEHTPSSNGTTFPIQLFSTGSNRSKNTTPRLASKPTEPPDQAEVQALIAQLIANKRPDLKSTPLRSGKSAMSTASTPAQKTGNIERDQKPNAAPNLFIEKAREMQEELQQIAQQIREIEQQDNFVLEKIPDFEDGSKEERDLIEHHTRLVVEKDQLSRRQDYLNVQLELNETECKISQLRSMLAINGDVDEQQNEEEVDGPIASIFQYERRRDSNALLLELKELVDRKDQLTHQLSDMEAEDEEGLEVNRRTLERTRQQQFVRGGSQEPFNMSRRLMNWLGGGQHATQ